VDILLSSDDFFCMVLWKLRLTMMMMFVRCG